MNKAYFNQSKVIIEAESFETLFRCALHEIICDMAAGDLPTADIEVNGARKYSLVSWKWACADKMWFTIDCVRHGDGKIVTVRHIDTPNFGRNVV